MEETIDELYERYLNEKLDLLFIDAGEIKYKNDLLWILNGDRKLIRNIRIRKVANDIYILEINNKYNLIDSRTNKLLFKNFYDWIAPFSKELILIKKNGKFNLYDLNTKKELLNEWYDEICYRSFRDNVYALVKKNGLYNEINIRTNEYCHKLWYDDNSREFHFGIISVNETTKAFVDMSNNEVIVENDVYESINNPVSNYAVVEKKQSEYEYNIIDLNTKKEILPIDYSEIEIIDDHYAMIRNDRRGQYRYNIMDLRTMGVIFSKWCDDIGILSSDSIIVKQDNKLIDFKTKRPILHECNGKIIIIADDIIKIENNGKYNLFNIKTKEFLLEKNVDYIYEFKDDIIEIKENRKYNLFNIKTKEFLLEKSIDVICKFKDDIIEIKENGKFNLFNIKTKEFLLEKNVDYICEFKDDIIKIENNGKYNLFNIKTKEFLLEKNVDEIYRFQDNILLIKENGKFNLINIKTKEFLLEKSVDEIDGIKDDIIKIKENGKWNLINIKTKELLLEKNVDEIYRFQDNILLIKENGKFNLINIKTKELLLEKSVDEIYRFQDNILRIKENQKYNLFDIKTKKLLFEKPYDSIEKGKKCYGISDVDEAIVIKDGKKYNLIHLKTMSLMLDEWYDEIGDIVSDGYVYVKKNFLKQTKCILNEKYLMYKELPEGLLYGYYDFCRGNYVLNQKGDILLKGDFRIDDLAILNFNGTVVISDDKGKGNYYFLDSENNLINKEGYNIISSYNYEYFLVEKNGKYNICLSNGQLASDKWWNLNGDISFLIKHGGYNCTISVAGYQCYSNDDVFRIKYQPHYIFGLRYVVCKNKQTYYLYDRELDKYEEIGEDIYIQGNLLFYNNEIYLIYHDNKINITKYYKDKLCNRLFINTVGNALDILTKESFIFDNYEEIDRILEEDRKRIKQIEKENKEKENENIKKQQIEALKQKEKQIKKEDEERKKKVKNALEGIKENLAILQQFMRNDQIERIHIDDIFIEENKHLIINPIYLMMIRIIDLSLVNFKNVRIDGIDFRGSNINLNPQLVYKKDLSNCNFEGVYIGPFTDFKDVDIRGTRFGPANDKRRIDYFNPSFQYAIYDETTTYNGVPFTEIFSKENKQTKGGK